MYYNTTNATGQSLSQNRDKADSQDALTLNCMLAIYSDKRKSITPRRVWAVYLCNYGPVELTSIRRSINTLIKRGDAAYTGSKLTHICPTAKYETTEKILRVIV
jgi:hypothetical protein